MKKTTAKKKKLINEKMLETLHYYAKFREDLAKFSDKPESHTGFSDEEQIDIKIKEFKKLIHSL